MNNDRMLELKSSDRIVMWKRGQQQYNESTPFQALIMIMLWNAAASEGRYFASSVTRGLLYFLTEPIFGHHDQKRAPSNNYTIHVM